jgi:hypothetical protein
VPRKKKGKGKTKKKERQIIVKAKPKAKCKAKPKAKSAEPEAEPSDAAAKPKDDKDILDLIKKYPLTLGMPKVIKNRFHSKIWHGERQRCKSNGMSDETCKQMAAAAATKACAQWTEFHITGGDIE